MFQLIDWKDHFGREYKKVICPTVDGLPEPVPITFIILAYNCSDYIQYVIDSIKPHAKRIFVIDNGSTDDTRDILGSNGIDFTVNREKGDLSRLANILLQQIPHGWTFIIDTDEVLFDLPADFLGKYAAFLEANKIFCSDFRFVDFVYNYGTLNANYDWGEGPGVYWVARKLFYYTGNERFVNKFHFNISNCDGKGTQFNQEHTGEWEGIVAKTSDICLFHYGKLRGVERMRKKEGSLLPNRELAWGKIATIPYSGPHPSVMNL